MFEHTVEIDCVVSGVSAWEHDHGTAHLLLGRFNHHFRRDPLRVVNVVLDAPVDEVHLLHQFTRCFVVKSFLTVVIRSQHKVLPKEFRVSLFPLFSVLWVFESL